MKRSQINTSRRASGFYMHHGSPKVTLSEYDFPNDTSRNSLQLHSTAILKSQADREHKYQEECT